MFQKKKVNQFLPKQYILKNSSLYGKNIRCDVIIYHPIKHPNNLVIECKYQKNKGTADEKIVYLVENIKKHYIHDTILVIEGDGFRGGVLDHYLPNNLGGNFVEYIDLNLFNDMCKKTQFKKIIFL